jgi:hypothetical protein
MFFSMMITLALASVMVEAAFAAKVKWWRINAHKLKWVNMVISIGMSYLLGEAFGAAGLITMGAAMLSTVLSIPMYQLLHWNYDTPSAHAHGGSEFNYYYAIFKSKLTGYKTTLNKWSIALSDLGKLIYSFIRFLTFPIWMTRDFIVWLRPYVVKYNNYVARKRLAKIRTTP